MEWYSTLLIILVLILVLFMSGLPVAFAFIVLNVIALYLWFGTSAWHLMVLSAYEVLTVYEMLAVLFFILMGEVLYHSGVVKDVFNAVDVFISKIPGRLSYVTLIVSVIIAAISGSVLGVGAALAATLGTEMRGKGYDISISSGPIMAGACLALIIPPSAMAVLLATLAHLSVGRMLIAGVVPGLLLWALFMVYLFVRISKNPSLAPMDQTLKASVSQKISSVLRILPLTVLFFLVTGTIFTGIATPTEASGLGALGAFVVAALYHRFNLRVINKAILASGELIGMIFLIVMGSKCFSQLLAGTGATGGMLDAVLALHLPAWCLIVMMQMIVVFMGMIMDDISIMMITLPIFMPILRAIGYNELLFGVLFLLNIGVSLLTPPFGLLIFVVKGVSPPETRILELYKIAIPWTIMMLAVMIVVAVFPWIALWLPSLIH